MASDVRKLAGRTAWISGGGSGMGAATARLFAGHGARVVVADIQGERGRDVVAEIARAGGQAAFHDCDVRLAEQVRESIDATAAAFGRLDILVNAAGVVHVAPLHEYSEQDWDMLFGVNLKSVYLATKFALPHLRRSPRSWIVNVGSIGSFTAQALTPAYNTSKAAVLQLTKAIAADYAADGLRCNCVCPGITDTPMLRYHLGKAPDPEALLARRLRRCPTGVALQADDIARAILYLACDDSAGITGTSLVVDGGYLAVSEWEGPPHTAFMDGT